MFVARSPILLVPAEDAKLLKGSVISWNSWPLWQTIFKLELLGTTVVCGVIRNWCSLEYLWQQDIVYEIDTVVYMFNWVARSFVFNHFQQKDISVFTRLVSLFMGFIINIEYCQPYLLIILLICFLFFWGGNNYWQKNLPLHRLLNLYGKKLLPRHLVPWVLIHISVCFFPPTSHPVINFYSVVMKVPDGFFVVVFSSLKDKWIALTVLVSAMLLCVQPL